MIMATHRCKFSCGSIEERGARVLPMCNRLRECVDSPETAQVTVSTVHKAKGLEWPRVLVAADFNRFITREHGVVRRNLEEACVIYVALTRARNQLLIHPECVKELKESSDALQSGSCRRCGRIEDHECDGGAARAYAARSRCEGI